MVPVSANGRHWICPGCRGPWAGKDSIAGLSRPIGDAETVLCCLLLEGRPHLPWECYFLQQGVGEDTWLPIPALPLRCQVTLGQTFAYLCSTLGLGPAQLHIAITSVLPAWAQSVGFSSDLACLRDSPMLELGPLWHPEGKQPLQEQMEALTVLE